MDNFNIVTDNFKIERDNFSIVKDNFKIETGNFRIATDSFLRSVENLNDRSSFRCGRGGSLPSSIWASMTWSNNPTTPTTMGDVDWPARRHKMTRVDALHIWSSFRQSAMQQACQLGLTLGYKRSAIYHAT
jgi:hypothetical protein